MKFLTLGLIFISLNSFAYCELGPHNQSAEDLLGISSLLESGSISLNSSRQLALARARQQECTPNERRVIEQARRDALRGIPAIRQQLTRAIAQMRTYREIHQRLQYSLSILNCAERKIPDATYYCSDLSRNMGAWTLPYIGSLVWFDRATLRHGGPSKIAGLVLHEATHKCGTNDGAYFEGQMTPSRYQHNWSYVADLYEYWLTNGFCVPGGHAVRNGARVCP